MLGWLVLRVAWLVPQRGRVSWRLLALYIHRGAEIRGGTNPMKFHIVVMAGRIRQAKAVVVKSP